MKRSIFPANIKNIFWSSVLFLCIMMLLRFLFIKIFPAPTVFADYPLGQSLWMGFRFDARIVAIVAVITFLIGLIPALNPIRNKKGKKTAVIIWTVAAAILILFYIVDFINYAYLHERMNADLLNLLQDTGDATNMMWQTYPIVKLLLLLVVGTIVINRIVHKIYSNRFGQQVIITKSAKISTSIAFFLVLALAIFGRLGQYPLRWSDAFSFGNDYAAKVSLNPFQSFFSSLKFRKNKVDIASVRKAYPLIVDYLGINHPDSNKLNYERSVAGNPNGNKPNIVIVICESFSFYKSTMSGNKLDPTPYFNQMSQQGILFDRCFTPSYGTARGVWATVTGIPDVDYTTTSSRNPKAVNQHTIMNDFTGYDKMYFIGGSLSWANIRGVLTNNIAGLKTYEQDDYNAPKIDVWGVSDKHVFLKANEVFAQEKKPFIAIVQTSDNHRPYTIPEEDKNAFKIKNVSDKELLDNGFATNPEYNAFRYTDFCYEQFIEAAKKEKYFDNTVFIFVGDHGIRGDAHLLYSKAWTEQLTSEHVPLLIYAPKLVKPNLYHNIASQVDVLPTAAGISQIAYTNTTLGRDVLSARYLSDSLRNAAFIYDYSNHLTGVVTDSIFFGYEPLGSIQPKYQSTVSNEEPMLNKNEKDYIKNLTDALYKTSQYMLLNNKVR